jgi:hypothetical protein
MDRYIPLNGVAEFVRDSLNEQVDQLAVTQARRTAFVARFIILREGKRSRAHRTIEHLKWESNATAEELAVKFRQAYIDNKDSIRAIDKDIKRALSHADRSIAFFVHEYNKRATLSFIEALEDYERSTVLLFGDGEVPRAGGWRLPKEIRKD